MRIPFCFLLLVAVKAAPINGDAADVRDASADSVEPVEVFQAAGSEEVQVDEDVNTQTNEQPKNTSSDDELDISTLNPDDFPPIQQNKVDKSSYTKLELTVDEINSKSDAELYELFYLNSKEKDAWVEETYRKMIDKMDKPDISDVELKTLFKKRDMMEERMEKMDIKRREKAEKVS